MAEKVRKIKTVIVHENQERKQKTKIIYFFFPLQNIYSICIQIVCAFFLQFH